MPKITFLPMNETFEVKKGETVLDVAIKNHIPMQHACGGFCACTTCHIHVESEAADVLFPAEDEELDRLEKVSDAKLNSRLGCQSKIQNDVIVTVVNVES